MNNMEDRLWDYIDGFCSAEEKLTIEQLMQSNADWKKKFDELTALHQQLNAMEIDEPSMGFKNRVMEQVMASPHPSALKTRVDKRIINGIGGFFAVTILGVLTYMLAGIDWNKSSGYELPPLKVPSVSWTQFDMSSFTLFFLSAFVVVGLFVLDKFISLRRHQEVA